MPCLKPLRGYRTEDGTMTFNAPNWNAQEETVSCGQCAGCRQRRKYDWAIRLHHESLMHAEACFLTLTYDSGVEGVPYFGTLNYRDPQLFLKNLRIRLWRKYKRKVRFFITGEYGKHGKGVHPHWHILLFGFDFNDTKEMVRWNNQAPELSLFTSPLLSELWPWGYHSFGSVTPASAAYCAGYIQKKLTGKKRDVYETMVNPLTGEIQAVAPEFSRCSLRPGIGFDYFDEYGMADLESGFTVFNGRKAPIPKAYWKRLQAQDGVLYDGLRYEYDEALEEYLASRPSIDEKRAAVIEECINLRVEMWNSNGRI